MYEWLVARDPFFVRYMIRKPLRCRGATRLMLRRAVPEPGRSRLERLAGGDAQSPWRCLLLLVAMIYRSWLVRVMPKTCRRCRGRQAGSTGPS
jgi:hypothetical protein